MNISGSTLIRTETFRRLRDDVRKVDVLPLMHHTAQMVVIGIEEYEQISKFQTYLLAKERGRAVKSSNTKNWDADTMRIPRGESVSEMPKKQNDGT